MLSTVKALALTVKVLPATIGASVRLRLVLQKALVVPSRNTVLPLTLMTTALELVSVPCAVIESNWMMSPGDRYWSA